MTIHGESPELTRPKQTRAEAVFTRAEHDRQYVRYAVELDVSFGSDHNFYNGFVENISAGGIFVATHRTIPVGERFELNINLPDCEEPITVLGEVRWIREYSESSDVPPGMGLKFLNLPPAAQTAIERFLQTRDPLFWDDD